MEGCVFALFLILFALYFLAACLTAGSLLGSLLLISIGTVVLIIVVARSIIIRKRPPWWSVVGLIFIVAIGIVWGGITLWVTKPWEHIRYFF
jgi:hypothetical protein